MISSRSASVRRSSLVAGAFGLCLFAAETILAQQAPKPAPVPEAVAIKRPTASEVALAEASLKKLLEAVDAETRAVLDKFPGLIAVVPPRENTAVIPALFPFFRNKHNENVAIAKKGNIDMLFMGDSITDFWRNPGGPFAGKAVFDKYFGEMKVANFGIAGDTTQGVVFRLQNGEGQGFSPKVVMLMIGTNNIGRNTGPEIAEGIGAVVLEMQKDFPEARILLLGIFPRGDANDPARATIKDINARIAKLDDGEHVTYLDIGAKFLDEKGNIPTDVMGDALHPSAKGYEIWAEAVKEPLAQLREPAAVGAGAN